MINVMKLCDKTICECENCGCRFSYEEKDVKMDKLYDMRNKLVATLPYVECPKCGISHRILSKG